MTRRITGATRLLAHIGVPTETFTAPMIYNPWFKACGADVVVAPMGCEAEDFPVFLRHLARLRNFAGALITMPHKGSAAALVDAASPGVAICGACNAVKRGADGELVGDMFDGAGFLRGAMRKGVAPAGASALIVGAGGVGAAIAAALAAAGAARLALCDLDAGRAEGLAARLRTHHPDREIVVAAAPNPAGADIVVNATPLGARAGDPPPLDAARLAPGAFVGDVALGTEETALLAAARARGCRTQTGRDMLFEQIPAYLDFFGLPSTTPETLRRLADLDR